jgi:hypothetical protein
VRAHWFDGCVNASYVVAESLMKDPPPTHSPPPPHTHTHTHIYIHPHTSQPAMGATRRWGLFDDEGAEALRSYKYVGQDLSLTYK